MLDRLESFERIFNRILKVFVFLLLAFMSTSVFYAIICRYLFQSAPFWVEEVARFMMVYMAFFGVAIAFSSRAHVGFKIIIERLISYRIRPFVILFSDLLTLTFFVFVVYHGVRFALRGEGVVSPATGISMLIPYFGVPIGCAFCLIQVSINIVKDMYKMCVSKMTPS